MAFTMESSVKIFGFKAFKPSSMKWLNTTLSYVNTATVVIPSKCKYNNKKIQTATPLKEGVKIEIQAGYNGNLARRFMGFISRVEMGTPLKIECEGYSYQLRQVTDFTKSYKDTTVKTILNDLIAGTDIVLSDKNPEVNIDKAEFIGQSGKEVLEWLKKRCLLTVYFNEDQLYVGLQQAETVEEVRFRLGWNTVSDDGLKFKERELANVNIVLESRTKDGKKSKIQTGSGNKKVLKTVLTNAVAKKAIAEQKRKELVQKGYSGDIAAFLEPLVIPGQTIQLRDVAAPEKDGQYFCSSVAGSFSKKGGRQTAEISYQV